MNKKGILAALLFISGCGSGGGSGGIEPPQNVNPRLATTVLWGSVDQTCEDSNITDTMATCNASRFVIDIRAQHAGTRPAENAVLHVYSVDHTEKRIFSKTFSIGTKATDDNMYWMPGDSTDLHHEVVSNVKIQFFHVRVISKGWRLGRLALQEKGICESVSRPDILRCYPTNQGE